MYWCSCKALWIICLCLPKTVQITAAKIKLSIKPIKVWLGLGTQTTQGLGKIMFWVKITTWGNIVVMVNETSADCREPTAFSQSQSLRFC